MNKRALALVGVIAFAALLRILPHPWNFAPITAMALFGGAHFRTRWAAFLIPLAALFVSDLFLGFYASMASTYFCFALVVLIGMSLKNSPSAARVLSTSMAASIVFFLTSNFGVYLFDHMYPHTGSGLVACYTAALPFFQGTLLGDVAYTAVLFGVFHLSESRIPALQTASSI